MVTNELNAAWSYLRWSPILMFVKELPLMMFVLSNKFINTSVILNHVTALQDKSRTIANCRVTIAVRFSIILNIHSIHSMNSPS